MQVGVLVGAAIRQRRDDRGLGAEQLAASVDLTLAALESIEQGVVTPRVATFVFLARALSCPAASLVASIPRADYERTPPRPGYRPAHEFVEGSSTASPVDDSEKALVLASLGSALRAYRRTTVHRPIHLIAFDCGLSYDRVARIERGGSNPPLAHLVNLTDAFDVSSATILDRANL